MYLDNCPKLDLLIVPGGRWTRKEVKNDTLLRCIADTSAKTSITASVRTGSSLLGRAWLNGRESTTHWRALISCKRRLRRQKYLMTFYLLWQSRFLLLQEYLLESTWPYVLWATFSEPALERQQLAIWNIHIPKAIREEVEAILNYQHNRNEQDSIIITLIFLIIHIYRSIGNPERLSDHLNQVFNVKLESITFPICVIQKTTHFLAQIDLH